MTLWDAFADKKAERDRDEEGLIECQDYKLGLPRCHRRAPRPDLHHIEGREDRPDLYFAEENLVWLIRSCHDLAHPNTPEPHAEAAHDQKRQMATTADSPKVLGLESSATINDKGPVGRTIYSSVQNRYASIVVSKKKKGI